LEAISRERLLQHYRRYYAPNNAVLVIAGDFETRNVQNQIQRYFGKIARAAEPSRQFLREPEQQGERRVKIIHQGNVPFLQIAYPAPDILNDDFYAMLILDAVLHGAKGLNLWATPWDTAPRRSSRLYKGLVDKRLATEVQSQLIPTQGSYLYRLTLALPDSFQFQPAEEAAIEQLERLKTYELTERELAMTRNQVIVQQFLDQNSASRRGHQLGYFESIASYQILGDFENKLSRVTQDDLRRVATRYFADKARTVGWLIPALKKQVIEVERLAAQDRTPETADVAFESNRNSADFALSGLYSRPAFRQAAVSRIGGATDPSQERSGAHTAPAQPDGWPSETKPKRKVLGNGVTLIVVENRFSPTVAIQASMKAGAMRETDAQAGIANLTARMLDRGTATRNVFQLADAFDFRGANLSIRTDYLAATALVQGLSKDVPAFLQLLSEMFQSPSFPQSEFEKLRTEVLGVLYRRLEDPSWLAGQGLRERLYSSGHPFRRMVPGTVTLVEKARLAQVVSFHKRWYRPDQLILSIAGDIRAESVFEFAEKVFGRWSASGTPEPFSVPAASVGPAASEHWMETRGQARSEILFGVPGISVRHRDYYPLLVLNQILGQGGLGGRLGERLRNEGLPASVESSFDASLAEGPFVIRAQVDPSRTQRVIELIREETGRIKQNGVNEQEIESAKKALIHGWPVQLESNEALARQLLLIELFQLGEDYLDQSPQLIAAVTKDRLLDCARSRLAFDHGALVIVGPKQRP
jgi:zinc protease